MEVKVLGTGCANCNRTLALIEQVSQAKGVAANINKIDNIQEIMSYNIMSLPSVVVDGKVVHSGSLPTREQIESWFA